jgi:hypothetical protein
MFERYKELGNFAIVPLTANRYRGVINEVDPILKQMFNLPHLPEMVK